MKNEQEEQYVLQIVNDYCRKFSDLKKRLYLNERDLEKRRDFHIFLGNR